MTGIRMRRLLLPLVVVCLWPTLAAAAATKRPHRSSVRHARFQSPQARQKPRAYLHIGPHKTGSTLIQEMLCAKTQELALANLIIPMAESCRPRCQPHFAGVAAQLKVEEGAGPLEHQDAARRLAQGYGCTPDPIQELGRDLRAANGSDVVISAEDFAKLGDRGVAALAALLSGYDTHVVIVYRQKLPHLMSFYFQVHRELAEKTAQPRPSFEQFYWWHVSNVDPASPTPLHTPMSGFFLSKLVHVYGKHFGKDKFIIVNYDNAGDDLWNIFATDVLQAHAARVATPPKRANKSPDPFVFAVAVHYYNARWGVSGPAQLPRTKCTLPVLAAAATGLPRRCTSLANVVGPWQREDGRVLEGLLASGSRLIKFGEDLGGQRGFNASVCDVDFEAASRMAGKKRHADALLWLLKEASDKIDAICV